MLSLRGHHLVCLHFFDGEGYDETFVENLCNIMGRTDEEDVAITSEADDVCASCLHLREGSCGYSKNADRDIREMDSKAVELLNLSDTEYTRWKELQGRVRNIFPKWYSLYCSDCDWRKTCEKNVFFKSLCTR